MKRGKEVKTSEQIHEDEVTKRRGFLRQVGTLAFFSVSSLSVIEAVQFPNVHPQEKKILNKPQYVGEITVKKDPCSVGTITCDPGGNCDTGAIVCNTGSC